MFKKNFYSLDYVNSLSLSKEGIYKCYQEIRDYSQDIYRCSFTKGEQKFQ